jgi:DNA segregation ATPase FtsK/SpoIIIE-like protein
MSNENTRDISALYNESLKLLREHGEISCVLIQIKLYVGYEEARAIMDRMISEGIIRAKGYKGIPIVDVSKLIEEVKG